METFQELCDREDHAFSGSQSKIDVNFHVHSRFFPDLWHYVSAISTFVLPVHTCHMNNYLVLSDEQCQFQHEQNIQDSLSI